uniref:Uncharacterized protein n=1 Tax=Oncorhynchus kisutch TaxID=8019 RepID=A0A8C7HYU9_ONCKI
MDVTTDHIRDKLIKEFGAIHVEVEDTSSNRCAASFKEQWVNCLFRGRMTD